LVILIRFEPMSLLLAPSGCPFGGYFCVCMTVYLLLVCLLAEVVAPQSCVHTCLSGLQVMNVVCAVQATLQSPNGHTNAVKLCH
jgi:hypothetical protein